MSWWSDGVTGLRGSAVAVGTGAPADDDPAWVEGIRAGIQVPIPSITPNSALFNDLSFLTLPGLPAVTETTAQSIAAVYSCVNLIAGAISAMPLNVHRLKADGDTIQLHNDDLWWMFNEEFLPRWAAPSGWEFIVQNLLFHGNGYAVIRRHPVTAMPIGLEPVHAMRVSVIPTPDRMRLVYTVGHDLRVPSSAPGYEIVDQDDMIHIAGFGFDGWYGLSPLKYHLQMAGAVALATQEHAARFFTNGARPDFAITSDQAISLEKAQEIQASVAARYSGYQNSHKPMVLGNGGKVQAITLSADDAQLLATRRFQVEEICRIYGVPPFMVGHMEKTTSWGSGIETMGQGFVRFTLRQHLEKICREINRKFFIKKSKFVQFDTFALEQADMATLFNSFATALGMGGGDPFMTTDEVRRLLKLQRTPGGGTLKQGQDDAQPTPQPAGE